MLEGDPVTFIATPLEENGSLLEVAASPAVAVKESATGEEMLTAEEANREQENQAETVETMYQDEPVTKEVVMEESAEQISEEKTEVESNPLSAKQVGMKGPIMYMYSCIYVKA